MDNNLDIVIQKRIERTVSALRKNRFEAHFIPTKKELISKIAEMMPDDCSCSAGGSVTFSETGVLDFLEEKGLFSFAGFADKANMEMMLREAFSCDFYLTSTNAITLDGKLYNLDCTANRVDAICFGSKKVIVVAGYYKIVSDIPAAQERVRSLAAPANCMRIGTKTPCAVDGVCRDCSSLDRLCSQELISGWQTNPERICVLILGEEYGY